MCPSRLRLPSNEIIQISGSDSTVYAMSSRGLAISYDSGASWVEKTSQDGFSRYIFAAIDAVYFSTFNGVSISRDNGQTWSSINTPTGIPTYLVEVFFAFDSMIYARTSEECSMC